MNLTISSVRFGQQAPSTTPRVAVMDLFDESEAEKYDIDGDGIDDLMHGVVIERFIKAGCPNAETVRFPVPLTEEGLISPESINDVCEKMLDRICEGDRFDALNLSISHGMENIDKSIAAGDVNNPDRKQTQSLRYKLRQAMSSHPNRFLRAIADTVMRLQDMLGHEIKCYIGGGNSGPKEINLYNTISGNIGVAATDANGVVAPFSANNALLNRKAQGIFSVTRVEGGFDLTGDGKVDVLTSEVSGGESLVERFRGKPLADVLASDEELKKMGEDDPELEKIRVISWKRAFELEVIPEEFYKKMSCLGDYALLHKRKPLAFYNVDAEGRLYFDPDRSGRKDAVNCLMGTSFAAPFALGQDLKAKYG